MVVTKEYILAAYYEARSTLAHEDAVAQVAGETGHDLETISRVLDEEVSA